MRKITLAFVAGVLTALTMGAASQYIYRHSVAVGITDAQAATGAQWFIDRGAWDGTVSAMDQCRLSRTSIPAYRTGLIAECYGRKTVAADMLPEGAKVLTVIN